MPVIKLTKTNVEKIPFSDKGQILFHDETLKGFLLRVGKNSKTYCVYNTINRKSKQITIGRHGVYTAEQARQAAKEKLYLMSQDIDPEKKERLEAQQNITLRTLFDEFMSVRTQLRPATLKGYKYCVLHYLSDWADKPVKDITEKMFLDRYLKIAKDNGHATANNVRRYASSLFNYAIAAYELYDKNPVELIRRTRSTLPDKRRTNVLTPSQLKTWWYAVEDLDGDIMTDYLKLVLLTGLRRNEASKIKWQHVNFEERTLVIPETKNGEKLILPMGDYLYNLLTKRVEDACDEWVFSSTSENGHLEEPKKAVSRVREATGIYFTVHDLRRTYMTIAASLEISAYALKRLVNHKTSHDVTGGYIILGVEQLRAPVQKIEDYILSKVFDDEKGRIDNRKLAK